MTTTTTTAATNDEDDGQMVVDDEGQLCTTAVKTGVSLTTQGIFVRSV
jgi:hypothetical protein